MHRNPIVANSIMADHQKTINTIGSTIALFNVVILILLTAAAYRNATFKEHFYIFLMIFPIVISCTTAILFAGGFTIPYFLRFSTNREIERTDSVIFFPDNQAAPGRSGYRPGITARSNPVSVTSGSFFASGETKINPNTILKPRATQEHHKHPRTDFSRLYQVPDTIPSFSRVINDQQLKSNDQRPTDRIIENDTKEETTLYYSTNNEKHLKFTASLMNVTDKKKFTRKPPFYSASESNLLLRKEARSPKSKNVISGAVDYGTITSPSFQTFPFKNSNMHSEVERSRLQPCIQLLKSEEEPNWPNKCLPPDEIDVEKPDDVIKVDVENLEEPCPKVELDLPISDPTTKVTEWLLHQPEKKSKSWTEKQKLQFKKLADSLRPKRHFKQRDFSKSCSLTIEKDLSCEVELSESSSEDKGASGLKTTDMNKFCILGRGYFYATETTDYLPVEDEENSRTIIGTEKESITKSLDEMDNIEEEQTI